LIPILRAWVAPFRVRSFQFQWPADLATSWGIEIEMLILAWYVLVETGSVQLLALFAALNSLGILVSPVFGAVGDRIGHRNLLCAMRISYLILALLLMTLAFLKLLSPLAVLIITTVAGVVRSSDFIMRSVLIGDTIPPANLTGAMSLQRSTADSARVAGSLAGAGLGATFGIGPTYAVISVLYFVSFLLTLRVHQTPIEIPTGSRALAPAALWRDLRDAALHVGQQPELMVFMVLVFLVNFTAFPLVNGLLPHVAKDIYHLDQAGLGTLVAGYASGALIGSLALSMFGGGWRPARSAIIFSVAWYCLLLVFARLQWPLAGIVMLFLCGFVQSICMVMMTIAMLRGADPRYRGRVMSLRTFAVLGLPLGLVMSGPLIDRFGFAATGTSYAAIGLVLVLAAAVYWRDHLWRLESPANVR
jgi:predicted MFS family arabinose efflux permease